MALFIWMNTDPLLHQTESSIGLCSHTHARTYTLAHKTTESVLRNPPESLEQMPKLLSLSLQSTRMLFFFFFFDATRPKGPSDALFLFAFHRKRSADSKKRKKEIFLKSFYAVRSDMTSFSILFPISPGT